MLDIHTYKTIDLPKKYRLQIQEIQDQIINDKEDEYWENYENFYLFEQAAVTVGLVDDDVKAFCSVFNNNFYGPDVYRILNRLYFAKDIRESGSTKTYKGEHRTFPMIQQQIEFVNSVNAKFYFISRQRKNTRWFKYFFNNPGFFSIHFFSDFFDNFGSESIKVSTKINFNVSLNLMYGVSSKY